MLLQDITGSLLAVGPLHNHSNDASCNLAFYHTGWYYEYRETFRHGLTAGWRLHIAMDCGRGSLSPTFELCH